MNPEIVNIYGLPGTGKTLNAPALMSLFRCDDFVDVMGDTLPRHSIPLSQRTLVLSNTPIKCGKGCSANVVAVVSVNVAQALLGREWKTNPNQK